MNFLLNKQLANMLFPLLYIDPGTGSMLFTIVVGLLGTAVYLLRNLWVRVRFLVTGGAREHMTDQNKIPFVIFAEHRRYWNLFEPICDEFEKRGRPVSYLTASPDDPALEKQYQYVQCRFIGEGNRAYAHLNFLNADVVLSTTPGLDVYQWKRSKDVSYYVHILHYTNDITMYRMFGIDYYDAVLLSGEYQKHQVRELERVRKLQEKELLVVGMPYLDTMERRLKEAEDHANHSLTVLLAPSWGETSIWGRYSGRIISALLETGYHIVVRPHPQSFISEKDVLDKLMSRFPESKQLEWNRDNDNFEVLRRSDILISDYSGVIFDYALVFQKPVIYADTSYDKAPYDACWLDEELWTFKTLPKIGRQLTEESLSNLKALIDDLVNNPQYRNAIAQAREEAWANIGSSASLTVDYLIQKQQDLKQNQLESSALDGNT